MQHLLRQLLLTQLVECEELLAERDVLQETAGGKLDTDDDGAVRHHHGHSTEVYLQVLRQLLTPSITRVLDGSSVMCIGQKLPCKKKINYHSFHLQTLL